MPAPGPIPTDLHPGDCPRRDHLRRSDRSLSLCDDLDAVAAGVPRRTCGRNSWRASGSWPAATIASTGGRPCRRVAVDDDLPPSVVIPDDRTALSARSPRRAGLVWGGSLRMASSTRSCGDGSIGSRHSPSSRDPPSGSRSASAYGPPGMSRETSREPATAASADDSRGHNS